MKKFFKIRLFSRLLSTVITLVIIILCVIIANIEGKSVPMTSILGAYASTLLVAIILYKFPLRIYISSLFFCVISVGLGSILRFYDIYSIFDNFTVYDKAVHIISGFILLDIGYYMMHNLLKKRFGTPNFHVSLFFATFFSIACAALWEIYEYTADLLLNTYMQGSNDDTMGDIIAGTLGAVIFCVVLLIIRKYPFKVDK